MAISAELVEFVKAGLDRGIPKQELNIVLRNAGWDREQISGAIASLCGWRFFDTGSAPGSVRQHARSIHVHPDVLTLYRSADRPRQPRVRLDQPCASRQRRARVSGTETR